MGPSENTRWAWIAGVLEGEGCFHSSNYGRIGSNRCFPRITVNSTDKDVLERLQSWSGNRGKIYGPRNNDNPNAKQFWVWSVHKKDEAIAIMQSVLPFMLSRRSIKIKVILDHYQ
jgi:hypothetical protein